MTNGEFVDACVANNLEKSIPEISKQIMISESAIIDWVNKNTSITKIVSPSVVSRFLIDSAMELINRKKAPIRIVQNVYNEYSVITAILASQNKIAGNKSLHNKIRNLFIATLANSKNFELYYKSSNVKHARTREIKPSFPVETYWFIPMFLNPNIFKTLNPKVFSQALKEFIQLSTNVSDFVGGYKHFVDTITTTDAKNYKQFIVDAYQEMSKIS
jgi:hypothetical protein